VVLVRFRHPQDLLVLRGTTKSTRKNLKGTIAFIQGLSLVLVIGLTLKGSLHRFEYGDFCVNVYTCISVVRPFIDVNLDLSIVFIDLPTSPWLGGAQSFFYE